MTKPMSNKHLSKKQSEVLNFIKEFLATHSYAPSYREIAQGLGLSSPATVFEHCQILTKKGYIQTDEGEARSFELTQKMGWFTKAVELPLIGMIAAGKPIEAIQQNERIAVPLELLPNLNCFVLQVKGDSMIEDGIHDGDYVVAERNFYPKNGDTVVALLENEYATLKRYYREPTRIRLQPANKTMKPIYAKNPVIQGIVKAVLRKY
ncbi:MAG: transcriptional repressor LexA [bacterium]|nr:transcriptional repressor LexA [bacterium]